MIEHLKQNAREVKCVSDFCIELDVWHQLAESKQFSELFVGDILFGHSNYSGEEGMSKEVILNSLEIKAAWAIGWLEFYISKKSFRQMCQCLNNLMDDIFETTKSFDNPFDKQDFIDLDQSNNHALMPWRENYCSQVGIVHNPFLDGDIFGIYDEIIPANAPEEIIIY